MEADVCLHFEHSCRRNTYARTRLERGRPCQGRTVEHKPYRRIRTGSCDRCDRHWRHKSGGGDGRHGRRRLRLRRWRGRLPLLQLQLLHPLLSPRLQPQNLYRLCRGELEVLWDHALFHALRPKLRQVVVEHPGRTKRKSLLHVAFLFALELSLQKHTREEM